MKKLRNNFNIKGVKAAKKERMKILKMKGALQVKADEIASVIAILKRDGYYKDIHFDNEYVRFKEGDQVPDGNIIDKNDIIFTILNCKDIVPIHAQAAYCSLNPIRYNWRADRIYLSTSSVGGCVCQDKIEDYEAGIFPHSLEEIDLETFDPYKYYKVRKNNMGKKRA